MLRDTQLFNEPPTFVEHEYLLPTSQELPSPEVRCNIL